MRIYNYLLFRIYRFYTDRFKEKDTPLTYVASISTLLVYFNLFTIYSFLIYRGFFKDIIPGKYYVLIPIGILWILNYSFFVKRKSFLENNFKKDTKGGVLIILYMLFTAASFIVVANYNRDKIFEQKHQRPVKEQIEQRPSLEGKIRKWWKDNF